MSNPNDLGFVGGVNGFEEWACDDFNLLEYVGADASPFADINRGGGDNDDYEEDENLRKKDMIYSTLQYNNALLPNEMHPMHNQQIDSYSDVPKFFDHNQVPNFSVDNSFNAQMNDPSIPSTSKTVTASTQHIQPIIKMEPTADAFEEFANRSSTRSTTHSESEDYLSKIKPRKYRIKPDTEKRNPQYRAKREKNNDAVRRSRDKAKHLQEQKEARLAFLEKEDSRKTHIIKQLQSRGEMLEKELIRYKSNCSCRLTQH